MQFRERLLATLRALRPVLGDGVMVVGSEVPNLLRLESPVPIIVSKDVDLGVEVTAHARVRDALAAVDGFHPSADEPSVLVSDEGLLEVNFVGIDRRLDDPTESYVLPDPKLPLLVFGALSLLRPGVEVDIGDAVVRLPEPAGLLVEKLLSERSSLKGERDLLVALALILGLDPEDEAAVHRGYSKLGREERHQIRANLSLLSMMAPIPDMPDPRPHRAAVGRLLRALEALDGDGRS